MGEGRDFCPTIPRTKNLVCYVPISQTSHNNQKGQKVSATDSWQDGVDINHHIGIIQRNSRARTNFKPTEIHIVRDEGTSHSQQYIGNGRTGS